MKKDRKLKIADIDVYQYSALTVRICDWLVTKLQEAVVAAEIVKLLVRFLINCRANKKKQKGKRHLTYCFWWFSDGPFASFYVGAMSRDEWMIFVSFAHASHAPNMFFTHLSKIMISRGADAWAQEHCRMSLSRFLPAECCKGVFNLSSVPYFLA